MRRHPDLRRGRPELLGKQHHRRADADLPGQRIKEPEDETVAEGIQLPVALRGRKKGRHCARQGFSFFRHRASWRLT